MKNQNGIVVVPFLLVLFFCANMFMCMQQILLHYQQILLYKTKRTACMSFTNTLIFQAIEYIKAIDQLQNHAKITITTKPINAICQNSIIKECFGCITIEQLDELHSVIDAKTIQDEHSYEHITCVLEKSEHNTYTIISWQKNEP